LTVVAGGIGVRVHREHSQKSHLYLHLTYKRMQDRDEVEEYYLHDRCALNTIDSWEEPY
jgi:hypothetical protein